MSLVNRTISTEKSWLACRTAKRFLISTRQLCVNKFGRDIAIFLRDREGHGGPGNNASDMPLHCLAALTSYIQPV